MTISYQFDPKNINGFVCFCFQKSKQELLECINNDRVDSFIAEIKAKMKDPGCFCSKANPSGKCCLVDINQFVEFHKNSEK